MSELLVTDTHALVWHVTGQGRKLGRAARRAYARAEEGDVLIAVPVVVLAEILEAAARGVLALDGGFERWLDRLERHPGFGPVGLSVQMLRVSAGLLRIPERPDRLIAATAAHFECPLITGDPEIAGAGVEVLWD